MKQNVKLGFIGIGRMGRLMAPRLIEAGYDVTVFDLSSEATMPLLEAGAHAASSASDVAARAEIVFLSLPSPDIVKEVALGENGIGAGGAIRICIDLSTTGPRAPILIAEGLAAKGIHWLDCPVSGGLARAKDGTLALMISGDRAVFEDVEPLLKVFGSSFYVSERPGAAQMLKVINNLLAASAQAISSEAMVLGVKAGLDADTMIQVINASSGRNTATLDKFPKSVLPRTFDFGFATALSLKDIRLCLQEAEDLGVPMMVGSAVRQLLAITSATYGPESDFTSMIRPLEDWSGVEVKGKV